MPQNRTLQAVAGLLVLIAGPLLAANTTGRPTRASLGLKGTVRLVVTRKVAGADTSEPRLVSVAEYDRNGYLLKETHFSQTGKPSHDMLYHYDDATSTLTITRAPFGDQKVVEAISTFQWNADGTFHTVTTTRGTPGWSVPVKRVYQYDAEGTLREVLVFNDKNVDALRYEYGPDGKTAGVWRMLDGNIVGRDVYAHGEDGVLRCEGRTAGDGSPRMQTVYTASGEVWQKYCFGPAGHLGWLRICEYEYDERGNWTEQVETNYQNRQDGLRAEQKWRYTRDIEYWE